MATHYRKNGAMEATRDIWTMIEEAPDYVSNVADLYHWSFNYDAGEGPISLFLDLIGYSADEYGANIYQLEDASGLGYVELSKLGRALVEYADRPQDVREWVENAVAAEIGRDE